jgi:hypothetical protein
VTITARREAARGGIPQDLGEARVCIEGKRALLRFSEPRGFGDSDYELHLDPTSFRDLVQVMLRTNAEETIKAFASALKDGIPAPAHAWYPHHMDRKPPEAA